MIPHISFSVVRSSFSVPLTLGERRTANGEQNRVHRYNPAGTMRKFIALLVLLAACGKRGDPHPPVPVIPKATSDLVVAQRGAKLILAWSYPALTTAGKKLDTVHRVLVYRYVEPLPVPQGGRDPNALRPGDIDTTVPA